MQIDKRYSKEKINHIAQDFEFLTAPELDSDGCSIYDERAGLKSARASRGAASVPLVVPGKRLAQALRVVSNRSRLDSARGKPFSVLESAAADISTPREEDPNNHL